jgi:hypothetical protein
MPPVLAKRKEKKGFFFLVTAWLSPPSDPLVHCADARVPHVSVRLRPATDTEMCTVQHGGERAAWQGSVSRISGGALTAAGS